MSIFITCTCNDTPHLKFRTLGNFGYHVMFVFTKTKLVIFFFLDHCFPRGKSQQQAYASLDSFNRNGVIMSIYLFIACCPRQCNLVTICARANTTPHIYANIHNSITNTLTHHFWKNTQRKSRFNTSCIVFYFANIYNWKLIKRENWWKYFEYFQRFAPLKLEAPAPGAYNDPRTALEGLKKITGLKRSPFGQTSIRFGPSGHTKTTPGKAKRMNFPFSYSISECQAG